MTSINKSQIQAIAQAVEAAAAVVAASHGVAFTPGRLTFGPTGSVTLNVLPVENGIVVTKEAAQLLAWGDKVGLSPDTLGRPVAVNGVAYTVAGLASDGCVVVERQKDKRRFKVLAHAVRAALVAAALVLVLLPHRAAAQSVDVAFDRAGVPEVEFGTAVPMPSDLDGNPLTREWYQITTDEVGRTLLRGLAVRASGLCVGEYFEPFARVADQMVPGDILIFGFVFGPTAGGQWRFIVVGTRGYYEVGIGYGC